MCSCTRTRMHARAHTGVGVRARQTVPRPGRKLESGKLQAAPLAQNPVFVAVHSGEPKAGWGSASEERIWLNVSGAVEGPSWRLMPRALDGSGQAPGTQAATFHVGPSAGVLGHAQDVVT